MSSDDEGVLFRANALDIVKSWMPGGDEELNENKVQQQLEKHPQRNPVTLYRPTSALSGMSLPSLTRPNTVNVNTDAVQINCDREMKQKLLRKSRGSREDESVMAELNMKLQREEVEDDEEKRLIISKTHDNKESMKRKRTTHDELLDKLRQEAAQKKAKNLKRKLQLQRKKLQQQKEISA
ncbi:hypothetical protein CCR75_009415 [Bremia lactucae]|uniref:Uncharacterized protein n=1 Tax=Bremia lactucae TaxID=4779 RepID=A0A976IH71_BRELC|nr:hypothetical protein CCR75_009415 [Bremia lactucae]